MNFQDIDASASPEVQVNENFETIEFSSVYGKRQPVTTGLTWGYYGGRWGGFSVAEGTLTLTNAATNYVVVLRSSGAISVSTASTNWDNTAAYARVYKLTTAGSVVTAVEDHRAGRLGVHGSLASVAGPVASTDGMPAVWNGTDGQLLKNPTAAQVKTAIGVGELAAVTSVAGTNTITGAIPAANATYATNGVYALIPAATNTGAATLNLTPSGGAALGAKNIFYGGAACVGGEIKVGLPILLYYDGTQFNLVGPHTAEVNWTPTLQDGTRSDAEGQAYSVQAGWAIKTGNLVTVGGRLTTTSIGTLSGSVVIAHLPWTSVSTANFYGSCSGASVRGMAITAGYAVNGFIIPGTDVIGLDLTDSTVGGSALQASEWSATGDFTFTATYRAA